MNYICFLDWDDTLLCSSWIAQLRKLCGDSEIEKEKPILSALEALVCKLIDVIYELGYSVYIVTNSEPGWVQKSSAEHMPGVLEKLNERKIPIVSAKGLYRMMLYPEPVEDHTVVDWKTITFHHLVAQFNPTQSENSPENGEQILDRLFLEKELPPSLASIAARLFSIPDSEPGAKTSEKLAEIGLQYPQKFEKRSTRAVQPTVELLSIGDSKLDQIAANSLTELDWIRVKTVKFIEFPDAAILMNEIQCLINELRRDLNFCSLRFDRFGSDEMLCQLWNKSNVNTNLVSVISSYPNFTLAPKNDKEPHSTTELSLVKLSSSESNSNVSLLESVSALVDPLRV